MADTNATYNTSITADFPDYASSIVKFTNEAFFISGNSEILAGKQYTMTLDANGQGTQVLPCPDNTGDAAVNWLITLPSKESGRYAIAYDATSQNLSDILAAGSTTTDPDDITAALANKANKVNGGTTDNIVTLTADGDIQDGGQKVSDLLPRNQIVVAANGDYTTVGAAIAAASSGNIILVDSNTTEAAATLTIPSGVTVRILPGRTVQFGGADVVFLATDSTSRLFDGVGEIVCLPSTWTWTDHGLLIRKNSRGGYEVGNYPDVSAWDFPVSPNVAYVDGQLGNNSNTGLSWAQAKKGVRFAFAMSPAPDIVYVRAGVYSDGDQAWASWKLVNDCAVIGVGGKAIISYHKSAADAGWAVDGTYTNTYSASITTVFEIRDALYLNEDGEYSKLALVADAATVNTTPNSWYTSAGTVWIRLRDDRVPDENVRPYRTGQFAGFSENVTLKLENLEFHGGTSAFSFQDDGYLWMKNVDIKYTANLGLAAWPTLAILDNVTCVDTVGDDGLNYKQDLGANPPNVIEIDCKTRRTAAGISETLDNGTTMHDGGQIIRVNGDYQKSGGRVVHDVGAGTKSFNVGCKAGQSSSQTNGASVGAAASSEVTDVWLIGCDLAGSQFDVDAVGASATVYYQDTIISRTKGSGSVATW